MSIQELLPLSAVRGHDTAVSLVYAIYSSLDNLKVYQSQCRDLGRKCGSLLLWLAGNTRNLEPERLGQVADEIERVIACIHDRVQAWANFSRTRAFIKQNEVKQGLAESYAELAECCDKFSMSLDLQPSTSTSSHSTLIARDRDEMRGTMAHVLQDIGELKLILSTHPPEDAVVVMQAIQEELQHKGLSDAQERELQEGLWELYQFTDRLPPMTNLTGQVKWTGNQKSISSGSNDIYRGLWLGRQTVSLWFPRNQTPVAQTLFQEQVGRWRNLDHPHILKLYGTAFIGGLICSVSPWFEGQTATEYAKGCGSEEKLRVIVEVASGLAYLHQNNVLHGDLRGANVMVSVAGDVCVSGYGISEFFEEGSASNVRWQAPEAINPSYALSPMPASDVWSFSMLCLELLSGHPPYADFGKDTTVAVVINEGSTPKRPSQYSAPGLTDAMWALLERCWQTDASKRPTMVELERDVANLISGKSQRARQTASVYSSASSTNDDSPRSLSTPSTGGSSRSGTGIFSLRRTPSFLSRHGSHRSSSETSISSSSVQSERASLHSDTESVHHFIQRQLSRHESVRASPLTRSDSGSGAKGLFRVASLSRLRSRTKSSGSINTVPSVPSISASQHEVVSSPRASSTFSHRSSTSLTSFAIINGERKSSNSALSQSLNMALQDPESIVKYTPEGSVDAGTLEGLVNRLFADTARAADDVAYRYIFLASYRVFATSEQLFNVMRSHFESAGKLDAEERNRKQYSIMLLIKTWLQLDYEDMNAHVLGIIKEFNAAVRGSQTLMALTREVASLIDMKIRGMNLNLTPAAPFKPFTRVVIPKASEILPYELAVAMTILEGGLFSKITHFDCIAQLQRVQGVQRFEKVMNTNTQLLNWVKKSILKSESVEARADVYKFFVNTADECQKLNNFASLSAIVNALNSSTIQRLVITRESHLRKHERQKLHRMLELLDPTRNHRAYRAAVRDHKSHCVPWLAVHLHDLHAVLVGYPSVVEVDGRPLVNFTRFTKLTTAIREVLQYKVPDLREQQNFGVSAYLEQQLQNTPSESTVDAFEARSRALAEQEERLREQRLPELRALGFSTAHGSSIAVPLSRTSTIAR